MPSHVTWLIVLMLLLQTSSACATWPHVSCGATVGLSLLCAQTWTCFCLSADFVQAMSGFRRAGLRQVLWNKISSATTKAKDMGSHLLPVVRACDRKVNTANGSDKTPYWTLTFCFQSSAVSPCHAINLKWMEVSFCYYFLMEGGG